MTLVAQWHSSWPEPRIYQTFHRPTRWRLVVWAIDPLSSERIEVTLTTTRTDLQSILQTVLSETKKLEASIHPQPEESGFTLSTFRARKSRQRRKKN